MGFHTHNCAICLASRQDWICRTCFGCEDCCSCEGARVSLVSRQSAEGALIIRRSEAHVTASKGKKKDGSPGANTAT